MVDARVDEDFALPSRVVCKSRLLRISPSLLTSLGEWVQALSQDVCFGIELDTTSLTLFVSHEMSLSLAVWQLNCLLVFVWKRVGQNRGFLNALRHVLRAIKFNHHYYVIFRRRVSQGYSHFSLCSFLMS